MISAEKKIIVIIPALNEVRTISNVVRAVLKYANEVIVIDDGSTDDTGNIAKKAGATVINHKTNMGYDISIEDGFKEALKRRADIFVTFDADGQHKAEDIENLSKHIVSGEADMVIGVRSEHVHFGEKLFMYYAKFRFGIEDPLCGLKAYSRKVYEQVGHFDTLQSIGTQLSFEVVKNGFKIKNIPISLNHREDNSRFYSHKIRANIKILRALWRIIIHI